MSLSTPVYLDASALIKLIVPEPGSDELNTELRGLTDVIVSELAITETSSAIGRRVREGELTAVAGRRLYAEVREIASICLGAELTPDTHRLAERLLMSARGVPLRSLDALHVASALENRASTLASFDRRMRRTAIAHHLAVVPDAV